MYSGFITTKRALPVVGVHQRIDSAAYRLVAPYVQAGRFGSRRQILRFEGVNGPDGLKAKSPGRREPGHLYNPATDRGDIPQLITDHYGTLVKALRSGDRVRAAFDAAWLAHYVCDGLTPAHHFPLDVQLAKYKANTAAKPRRLKHAVVVGGRTPVEVFKNNWALWGGKGLLSTHFNFEMGIAAALVGRRIRARLNPLELQQASELGALAYFKLQARDVAALELYDEFYARGWNAELGRTILRRLLPQIVQTIAIIWLLAYQEAGLPLATPLAERARG